MKSLRLFTLLSLTASAFAADPIFVTLDGKATPASIIAKSAPATVTAPLIYGGIGDVPATDWVGKVVLLDRGVITFAAKASGAKSVGAVGVIIANTATATYPPNPTLDPDSSTIPAVFVSYLDGEILKTKVGANVRVGSPLPPVVVPDPAGHAGEYLMSDGTKLIFAKPAAPTPPVVTPPGPDDAIAGTTVTYIATADGIPPPTFTWKKDGALLADATNAVLTLNAVTAANSGLYTVVATNAEGSAESPSVKLNVVPAP